MGIHIIWKAELKTVSGFLSKLAFLMKSHHSSGGDTLLTDKLLGEFHHMLTEFQGLFSKWTYENLRKGRQADFEIESDPNRKIPFHSSLCIYLRGEWELRGQIYKVIHCGWIQPSWSNFGSPVLFMPQPDGTLCMCIDYRATNTIAIKDRYPLHHIEDLPNSMNGIWFTKLDLAAGWHHIASQQPTGNRWPSPQNLVCMSGVFCRLAGQTHPASSCTWQTECWSQWNADSSLCTAKILWFPAKPKWNMLYELMTC